MTYALDTDICIDVLRQREPVRSRVARHAPGEIAVTSMTVAELWYGAMNGSDPGRDHERIMVFLDPLRDPLSFDETAARLHAEVRYSLRPKAIGERDLVIASTVLTHGATLVTHNAREFSRVPGLTVEDWAD